MIGANPSPPPRMDRCDRTVRKVSPLSGRSLRWVPPTPAAVQSHPLVRRAHISTPTSSHPNILHISPPSSSVSHLNTSHTSSHSTPVTSHSTHSTSLHSNTHSKPMAMCITPRGTRLMPRRKEPERGGTHGVTPLMMGKTRKASGNSRSPGK